MNLSLVGYAPSDNPEIAMAVSYLGHIKVGEIIELI